jgi:hypothetical protein
VCASTKPGVTSRPAASSVASQRRAPRRRDDAVAVHGDVAAKGRAAVPSTTLPSRITRSCIEASGRGEAQAVHRIGSPPG